MRLWVAPSGLVLTIRRDTCLVLVWDLSASINLFVFPALACRVPDPPAADLMSAHAARAHRDGLDGLDTVIETGMALELDPELGAHLSADERALASRSSPVGVVAIAPGVWTPHTSPHSSIYALVVLSGTLARETTLSRYATLELLTTEDIVPPSVTNDDQSIIEPVATLHALTPVRLMVLGPEFVQAGLRWPSLLTGVQRRLARQQARASTHSLALHQPQVAHRVLLTLWLWAERCGRVTPAGLMLPLEFTHETLSRLTAAQRSTVSFALKELQVDGLLIVRDDGRSVLTAAAKTIIEELTGPDQPAQALDVSLAPPR